MTTSDQWKKNPWDRICHPRSNSTVVSYSGGYGVHTPANGTNNIFLCLLAEIDLGGWWLTPSPLARCNGKSDGWRAIVFQWGNNDNRGCNIVVWNSLQPPFLFHTGMDGKAAKWWYVCCIRGRNIRYEECDADRNPKNSKIPRFIAYRSNIAGPNCASVALC